ncbi:hypothetical protein MIJ3_00258 [Pseudomonas phage vB_PaeM_MIJ3]|nr:hypothetical protein MIJ3_00258 [Pseudomonas phage vB_PaeM_MIJ3]
MILKLSYNAREICIELSTIYTCIWIRREKGIVLYRRMIYDTKLMNIGNYDYTTYISHEIGGSGWTSYKNLKKC